MGTKIESSVTLEEIVDAARTALPQGVSLAEINQSLTENHVEHSFYKPTNQIFAAIRDILGGFFRFLRMRKSSSRSVIQRNEQQ